VAGPHSSRTTAGWKSEPATLAGTAEFQVQNVLAAAAAARAHGVEPELVAAALADFTLDHHSEGRVNLFALNGGYVMVDYGHNPAALDALSRTVSNWGATRVTQVVALPGDRADALIAEAARAIHSVDRVIIREDEDLRGRQPGEVAELLRRTLQHERPELPVRIVLDELNAVREAVDEMQPGEVVVALCERVQAVVEWLASREAAPVTHFQPLSSGEARPRPAA
jgi:cyanophycin synthetase